MADMKVATTVNELVYQKRVLVYKTGTHGHVILSPDAVVLRDDPIEVLDISIQWWRAGW